MFKNGKLFGKINIIDLIIIVVIIVAAAVVGLRVMKNKSQNDNKQTVIMKYYIEEVNDFVVDKVQSGNLLYDDDNDVQLGKVTNVETNDSVSYAATANGEYVLASKEGMKSMIITGECAGVKTDYGAEVDGIKYGVGHSMVLRAGDAKLYLRVYDIAVKE